ncbi:hypothetical protein AAG906_024567 [Vitis piasezkii]
MASTGPPDFKEIEFLVNKRGIQLIIAHLGTGNEMDRSCAYTSYKGKPYCLTVEFFPHTQARLLCHEIDLSTIDVLLVIPFHLDHAASLPYYLGEDISVHSDSNMKAEFLKQHLQLQSIKLFPTQALGAFITILDGKERDIACLVTKVEDLILEDNNMEFRLKWMILYWFSHPFIHPKTINYMCEDIGIISRSQNSLHANGSSRASGAMELSEENSMRRSTRLDAAFN